MDEVDVRLSDDLLRAAQIRNRPGIAMRCNHATPLLGGERGCFTGFGPVTQLALDQGQRQFAAGAKNAAMTRLRQDS